MYRRRDPVFRERVVSHPLIFGTYRTDFHPRDSLSVPETWHPACHFAPRRGTGRLPLGEPVVFRSSPVDQPYVPMRYPLLGSCVGASRREPSGLTGRRPPRTLRRSRSTAPASDEPMRRAALRAVTTIALMTLSAVPSLAQAPADPLLRDTGGGDRYFGPGFAARSPSLARNGMAATSHPLATQVAVDVLRAGGNAIDAAIAANAAIGVLEPTGNGLGGDLFAILWSAREGRLYGLNASGRSPLGLTLEQLRAELGEAEEIPLLGPLPVTVPGAVDGWWELHRRFGSRPWAELLEPAAHPLCRARARRCRRTSPGSGRARSGWRTSPASRRRFCPAAARRDRRGVPQSRPRHHAAADRGRGPRRLLPRRDRAHHGRLLPSRRLLPALRGPGRAPLRVGRAVGVDFHGYRMCTRSRRTARGSRCCRRSGCSSRSTSARWATTAPTTCIT
jgi:hypothetical protein